MTANTARNAASETKTGISKTKRVRTVSVVLSDKTRWPHDLRIHVDSVNPLDTGDHADGAGDVQPQGPGVH